MSRSSDVKGSPQRLAASSSQRKPGGPAGGGDATGSEAWSGIGADGRSRAGGRSSRSPVAGWRDATTRGGAGSGSGGRGRTGGGASGGGTISEPPEDSTGMPKYRIQYPVPVRSRGRAVANAGRGGTGRNRARSATSWRRNSALSSVEAPRDRAERRTRRSEETTTTRRVSVSRSSQRSMTRSASWPGPAWMISALTPAAWRSSEPWKGPPSHTNVHCWRA